MSDIIASHLAQHVQLKTVGDLWTLAKLQG